MVQPDGQAQALLGEAIHLPTTLLLIRSSSFPYTNTLIMASFQWFQGLGINAGGAVPPVHGHVGAAHHPCDAVNISFLGCLLLGSVDQHWQM